MCKLLRYLQGNEVKSDNSENQKLQHLEIAEFGLIRPMFKT